MLPQRIVITLCVSLLLAATTSAQSVTFNTTTYSRNNLWSQNEGRNGHVRADLNGDGREDFISGNDASFNSGCTGSFAVTLSTGDGAYAAPVCYSIPNGVALYFAVGDFTGVGKLDIAVTNNLGQAYIYLNNGTGTLTLGSTVDLNGVAGGIVAADVFHTGHLDLVYTVPNPASSTQNVNVAEGDGTGTFSSGPVTSFTMSEPAGALAVGDFDGDGVGDVLVLGVSQVSNVILYGNGDGTFTPGTVFGTHAQYAPADSNSDGTMSVIGVATPAAGSSESKVLDLEHGHSDRQLTSQLITLKSCVSGGPPVLADFDGDGINDLIVAEDSDCKGDPPYTLNFMKNTGNSTFQPEQVIYTTNDWISTYSVMRASQSSAPDLTVWQSQLVDGSQIANPEQLVLVNTTTGNFPSCTPLNYRPTGISVCSPTSWVGATSPVNFSFAGANETPGRDMEIWVDGNKMDEQLTHNYSYYDFVQDSIPLSDGEHQVAIYSVGWDYSLLEYQFPLFVGSDTCPSPDDGLLVCSPMSDSILPASQPVLAYAASGVPSGLAITRMEVWVDGVKMYSTYGSTMLKTNLNLGPGWHQFAYYVVYNNGSNQGVIFYAQVK
jgi:FG-GAP-like repeat